MRGQASKMEQHESHVDGVQPSHTRTILACYFWSQDGPCFLSKTIRFWVAEDFWRKGNLKPTGSGRHQDKDTQDKALKGPRRLGWSIMAGCSVLAHPRPRQVPQLVHSQSHRPGLLPQAAASHCPFCLNGNRTKALQRGGESHPPTSNMTGRLPATAPPSTTTF